MKKLFFFLLAVNGAAITYAQDNNANANNSGHHKRRWYKNDSLLSRWVVDINAIGGVLTQELNVANTSSNYTNGIAGNNTGKLKFDNGMSYGGDIQLGYFFGKRGHFGIGTGLMYMNQTGDLTLSNFGVQFQSTDGMGNTFRQVIKTHSKLNNDPSKIKEKITIDNVNIPLLLKYKARFSRRFGFTADAGIMYNVQYKNTYETDAAFDYEAIYQATKPGDGTPYVYDNGVVPSTKDYMITQSAFFDKNPSGNVGTYFQSQYNHGYNVGLQVEPDTKKGNVSYSTGSVGFLFQPGLNYFLSDWCALNIGGYFLYQPFNNSVPSGYRLTDKVGSYNSSLNSVSSGAATSYGGNLGVRFFFGKKSPAPAITFIDQADPSACGSCDGSVTLYGLPRGKSVTISYQLNGIPQTAYNGVVSADGSVKMTNMCAGYYTDIVAHVGNRSSAPTTVVLNEPIVKISATNMTNPSAYGKCDGTITLVGIGSNRAVVVNYNYNDAAQPAFSGNVGPDNKLTLTGLCGGKYTNIVVSANNCSGAASDVTLVTPPPPPVEKPRQPAIDPSTPILFDLGKTQIHESSLDILEEAVLELNDNKTSYIVIDGHTDDLGTPSSNRVLSYKRAQAVKEYLKEMGIEDKRLITVGHGEEEPAAPNTSSEGRAKNRRVIMTLRNGNPSAK